MRLSEKTLELAITAQFTDRLGIANATWFGLTHRRECRVGYDIASRTDDEAFAFATTISGISVVP
jgi:hypothetical protein